MKLPTHRTADGTVMPISEMSDRHLRNTINLWERKAERGITVILDGGGFDLEEMWADVETLYGQDALDWLNHAAYVAEADRRAALAAEKGDEHE